MTLAAQQILITFSAHQFSLLFVHSSLLIDHFSLIFLRLISKSQHTAVARARFHFFSFVSCIHFFLHSTYVFFPPTKIQNNFNTNFSRWKNKNYFQINLFRSESISNSTFVCEQCECVIEMRFGWVLLLLWQACWCRPDTHTNSQQLTHTHSHVVTSSFSRSVCHKQDSSTYRTEQDRTQHIHRTASSLSSFHYIPHYIITKQHNDTDTQLNGRRTRRERFTNVQSECEIELLKCKMLLICRFTKPFEGP